MTALFPESLAAAPQVFRLRTGEPKVACQGNPRSFGLSPLTRPAGRPSRVAERRQAIAHSLSCGHLPAMSRVSERRKWPLSCRWHSALPAAKPRLFPAVAPRLMKVVLGSFASGLVFKGWGFERRHPTSSRRIVEPRLIITQKRESLPLCLAHHGWPLALRRTHRFQEGSVVPPNLLRVRMVLP